MNIFNIATTIWTTFASNWFTIVGLLVLAWVTVLILLVITSAMVEKSNGMLGVVGGFIGVIVSAVLVGLLKIVTYLGSALVALSLVLYLLH